MSLSRYSNYKETDIEWIGNIPNDWDIVPLRAVLNFRNEKNDPVRTEDILSLSIAHGVTKYSEEGRGGNKRKDDLSAYKIAHPNDIVMNSMNVIVGAVGISKYYGAISPVYYALYKSDDFSSLNYYSYIFQNVSFQKGLLRFGKGILIKVSDTGKLNTIRMKISQEDLKVMYFPKPSLQEQTQIARFLDYETARIDALLEEQQRLILLLKEKRQAVISHTVTKGLDPNVPMKGSGVEWLGEVPAHWELLNLKWVAYFQRGHDLPTDSRGQGEVPVVSSGGYSGTHSVHCAKAPGIVTGRYGSIGNFTFVNKDYWPLNTALYTIDLYDNVPRYVWYMLQAYSEHFTLNSLKSAVPGVDRNDIHEVTIVKASIAEQERIVNYLDEECQKIDRLLSIASQKNSLLYERRAALISAAVTGKIDVRSWQPPANKNKKPALQEAAHG